MARWLRRTSAALAAAAAALGGWALLVEPRRLVVRRRTLRLERWPQRLDGYTVVLVSDLHTGAPHVKPKTVAKIVRRANRQRADVALLLGDYVDPDVPGGERVGPEAVARELARLQAPAYAVLGNHDWVHAGHAMWAALERAGIEVLENEAVAVPGGPTLAAVADATTREPQIGEALRDAADPVLLLSHDPDVFPQVPARVALTVCGHTHGGQVDVPLLRRLAIPSRHGDRYAKGHVVEGGRHLYVTSGIGTSRWPIRLRRPPELVVLRLRPTSVQA